MKPLVNTNDKRGTPPVFPEFSRTQTTHTFGTAFAIHVPHGNVRRTEFRNTFEPHQTADIGEEVLPALVKSTSQERVRKADPSWRISCLQVCLVSGIIPVAVTLVFWLLGIFEI